MKFFRLIFAFFLFSAALQSCSKEKAKLWEKTDASPEKVTVTDISREFYDPAVALEDFKAKYPWFQGTVPDEDFGKRKTDTEEIKIYKEATAKLNVQKLQNDLGGLFTQIKTYFPQFKSPQVFIFSSALQMAKDPVFYQPQANMLFIDITGFMGDKNANYSDVENYFRTSMNPENLLPKVSMVLAETLMPPANEHQKFIDQIVLNGKIMTLQDAFLPGTPDHLKINYTPKQYEWAKANEANIWNYFVENNLVFSDDMKLGERFLSPGPFSKFYTQIDNESSPQIGIFSGWQICRAFYNKHPETKLSDFLKMNATDIFNQSEYKP